MDLRRRYMATRSSQVVLALAAAGVGAFWLAVAPHVVVRHWPSETAGVQCRQLLTGAQQWSDPSAGFASWTAHRAGDPHYC